MTFFDEAARRPARAGIFRRPSHRRDEARIAAVAETPAFASPETLRYRERYRQDPRPRPRGRPRPATAALAVSAVLFVVACGKDPAGPGQASVSLLVAEGAGQFALPGQTADLPLVVRAVDPSRGTGVKDIQITWTVVSGDGAAVTALSARTDGSGLASARARLGPSTGKYRFEADASTNVGDPAAFALEAVAAPVISGVTPSQVGAGQPVTISGSNFRSAPQENIVLFGGLRGTVQTAEPNRLVVTVPPCAVTRDTDLRVMLGAVSSNTVSIRTIEASPAAVSLLPGQTARFTQPADLACIRLAGVPAGARFLVIPQNAAPTFSVPMRYELLANVTGIAASALDRPVTRSAPLDAATSFETRLRLMEREFARPGNAPPVEAASRPQFTSIPAVGDRRDFNVLAKGGGTNRITATVRSLSQHAITYVDVNAPSPGLSDADIDRFESLFDDPIYSTDASVFGQPSDIDANQRIIILFTPAVNALTERTEAGFIAGYFYGCDLVDKTRCSATNSGEIFYSVVPDPNGQYSGARSKDIVLRTVPAVLAHEFQHMINFSRKGERLDVLWLSEALAHAAEDIVGDVFASRGDAVTAADFRRPNYLRAQYYLQKVRDVALLSDESPGSLEQRGGAWLLLKYAMMHYGGTSLLGALTTSSALGSANLAGATGRPWVELLSDFAVALWADRAPELAGLTLDPHLTYGGFDLRAAVSVGGIYPLVPTSAPYQNLQLTGTYPAVSSDYLIFESNSAQAGLNLSFAGEYGGDFASGATPQIRILRIR